RPVPRRREDLGAVAGRQDDPFFDLRHRSKPRRHPRDLVSREGELLAHLQGRGPVAETHDHERQAQTPIMRRIITPNPRMDRYAAFRPRHPPEKIRSYITTANISQASNDHFSRRIRCQSSCAWEL